MATFSLLLLVIYNKTNMLAEATLQLQQRQQQRTLTLAQPHCLHFCLPLHWPLAGAVPQMALGVP